MDVSNSSNFLSVMGGGLDFGLIVSMRIALRKLASKFIHHCSRS